MARCLTFWVFALGVSAILLFVRSSEAQELAEAPDGDRIRFEDAGLNCTMGVEGFSRLATSEWGGWVRLDLYVGFREGPDLYQGMTPSRRYGKTELKTKVIDATVPFVIHRSFRDKDYRWLDYQINVQQDRIDFATLSEFYELHILGVLSEGGSKEADCGDRCVHGADSTPPMPPVLALRTRLSSVSRNSETGALSRQILAIHDARSDVNNDSPSSIRFFMGNRVLEELLLNNGVSISPEFEKTHWGNAALQGALDHSIRKHIERKLESLGPTQQTSDDLWEELFSSMPEQVISQVITHCETTSKTYEPSTKE